MFRKIFPAAILSATILICGLSSMHANASDLGVQASILYTGENTGGSLLPHFLNNSGFGGKVSIEYPTSTVNFNIGLNSIHSHLRDKQSGLIGHTGLSIDVGKEVGIAHLSARQSYMHTATDSDDFFLHDIYETILRAEMANGTQRPYVFTGVVVPAYVPIEKVVGMGGFGLINHVPMHNSPGWKTGIHIDTSVAMSLLNINREPETVVQSRVTLQMKSKNTPLEIGLGFNLFQDIRRKEYNTWWDFGVSSQF